MRTLSKPLPGLTEGSELTAAQPLRVPDGAEVTLDYVRGARVTLVGPALAQIAVEPLDGLLLAHGVASIDLPPAATTPDSGFWAAAPAGRIDIVRGARVALQAFPGGELAALVVSGNASLSSGTEQELGRAGALLAPGELMRARASGLARGKLPGLTLEQALAKVGELRSSAKDDAPRILDEALVQLSAQVEEATALEGELIATHRASLRADASAMAAQADLSRHAAALAGLKKRLRTLLAQRSAARLGLAPETMDPTGEKAQRLLGRTP